MGRKITKNFHFEIPINQCTNLNGRSTVVHHGNLSIKGVAESYGSECQIDLEEVSWNGMDIFPMLDNNPFGWDLEPIVSAAVEHVSGLFEEDQMDWQRRMHEDEKYQDAQDMLLEMRGGQGV